MSDDVFTEILKAEAIHRLGRSDLNLERVWRALRSSPNDLRAQGLMTANHNDYRLNGVPHTFWLMTATIDGVDRAFKGEGKSDEEALDLIRAAYAKATDNRHHAPLCPANHYHGARAPTGPCSCGAGKPATGT